MDGEKIVGSSGEVLASLGEVLGDDAVEETVEWRHRPTHAIDPDTGQGDAHVTFAFAAHRAVVDVDTELGLVRVVEIATAQDVGKAINPQAVEGQIEGGIAQGLGLALMEEIQVAGGVVRTRDRGIVGEATVDFIRQFRVDIALIGISGIEADGTLRDFDYREVKVAQAIIAQSREVWLAADHSKFARRAMVQLAHLSQVDVLFTDQPLTPQFQACLEESGGQCVVG